MNYSNFSSLSREFDLNFTDDALLNGKWAEHIFRMSAYAKVPTFVEKVGSNFNLIDVNSILMKSGTKENGKADATLVSDTTVILVSCKWGKQSGRDAYDLSKLKDLAFTEFPKYSHIFGYSGKDPNFNNINEISFDKTYLEKCWTELWDFLQDNNFNWNSIDEKLKGRVILKYKKHQLDAIAKAKEVFLNYDKCLFYHSPRTGKTVTALGTAKSLRCKKILWLTPLPSINYQITDTVMLFDKFASWSYYDFNDYKSTGNLENANVVVCSFQRLDDQNKYAKLLDMNWDLVIIDEVHIHSESNNNQDIIENLKTDKMLWLSATPFKNIALGRFNESNTHVFTNKELYEIQKTDSDYAKYPKINYLLYSSECLKLLIKKASEFYNENEWFTFSKLFEIQNDQFVYENQIRELIDGFFVNNFNRIGLRSLDKFQQTKSVLLFVPSVKSQSILCELMKEIFEKNNLDNIYSVDFTNSEINNGKTLKNWIVTNERNSKQINVVIAVDQLSCGVTLPTCDMVVLWEDGKSEAEYIQRTERCKNPKDNVKNVYVIDFNPHRCIQANGVQIEFNKNKNAINVASIIEYLDHMNIFIYDNKEKFKSIDPNFFLDIFETLNYPLTSFEKIKCNSNVDKTTLSIFKKIDSLTEKTISSRTKKLDDELGREGGIQNTTREYDKVDSDDQEEDKKNQTQDEKNKELIKNFLKLIPWFDLMGASKHKNFVDWFDTLRN